MPINQQRLQVRLRRCSWIVAVLAVAYIYTRYDTLNLPEGGCSPLVRFAAGDMLLLDTRPVGFAPDDALLFSATDEGVRKLHLGRVERVLPEGSSRDQVLQVWVVTDSANCPGLDSSTLGWIDREECQARVLFAWPW